MPGKLNGEQPFRKRQDAGSIPALGLSLDASGIADFLLLGGLAALLDGRAARPKGKR